MVIKKIAVLVKARYLYDRVELRLLYRTLVCLIEITKYAPTN